jgi:hypothetical protein
MAQVPAMVGAGVTDFRVQLSLPAGRAEATEVLAAAVAASRAAG